MAKGGICPLGKAKIVSMIWHTLSYCHTAAIQMNSGSWDKTIPLILNEIEGKGTKMCLLATTVQFGS